MQTGQLNLWGKIKIENDDKIYITLSDNEKKNSQYQCTRQQSKVNEKMQTNINTSIQQHYPNINNK